MANKIGRVPVREQDPILRARNFEEVCYGYNEQEAVLEASRCLNCRNPRCVAACPVGIKIPNFIQQILAEDFEQAYHIILQDSSLPAICGRVCPQETQCEGACILGVRGEPVAIGKLERFAADYNRERILDRKRALDGPASQEISVENAGEALHGNAEALPETIANEINAEGGLPGAANGIKVAVIGSGPSGLACASDLAKNGYDVTVFESLHELGGVLTYGIPEFRLPKKAVVEKEIDSLRGLGVKFQTNVFVGRTVTIDSLMQEENFKAVFIGNGAGLPVFLGIEGENLNGVFSANEFLTRNNLMHAYDNEYDTPIYRGREICVVGGGNVAMDAARTALRLGARVTIVYRRSEKELPARAEEVHHAKEEGIEFRMLSNPVQVIGNEDGWVMALRCVKMQLTEADQSGRARPVPVEGSEFDIKCDGVIVALGTRINSVVTSTTTGIQTDSKGRIVTDETGATTREGVFAGGDVVTGAATVILAMGEGRRCAASIHRYLQNKFTAS